MIVAVLDAIDEDGLLAHVRAVSAYLRETCIVGPVVAAQGEGLLVGLRTAPPAKQVMAALLERDILTGTSADPHVLRLLPPLVLQREHVDLLRAALAEVAGVKRFVSPRRAAPRGGRSTCWRSPAASSARPSRRRSPAGCWRCCSSTRRCAPWPRSSRRWRGWAAARFVISPGQGSWQLETRNGVVMDGAAAEHVREAMPVLACYADALGIRAFAGGTRPRRRPRRQRPSARMAGVCPVPLVNLESAIDHPCQALGDWKTLDDLAVPRARQARPVLGRITPSRCRSRCRRPRCTWRRCAAWRWWCCARTATRCPRR